MDTTHIDDKISIVSAGGAEINYEIAGLGGRSYAYIIDWHIKSLLGLAWFLGTLYLFFETFDFDVVFDSIDESKTAFWIWLLIVVLPSVIITFLYHPILELVMKGRTPGKRMAGVRVISKNGYTASMGAILVRNVFRLIDSFPGGLYCIGLLVAMFTKKKVRLGDIAAGTVLVYEERVTAKGIDHIIQQAEHTGTTRDRELATELLERWRELDRKVRMELAGTLLTRFGQTPPQAKWSATRDRLLRQQLQQALKG